MVLFMCFAVTCWLTRLTRDILTNKGFFLKSSSVQSQYLTHPVESLVCSSRKSVLLAKMLLVSIYLNKYWALMGALLCCAHFSFTKPKLSVASKIYGGTWVDSFRGWDEILLLLRPRTWMTFSCLMLPVVHYTFYLCHAGRGGVGGTVEMFSVHRPFWAKHLFIWFWRDWTWWARWPCSSSFYAALSWLHQWHKYVINNTIYSSAAFT